MSENITHTAIADDVRRLLVEDPSLPPLLRESMLERHESLRLGAVTRGGDQWTIAIVDWARQQPPPDSGGPDPQVKDKLAFVMGTLTHRAADRLMKPLVQFHRENEPDKAFDGGRECTMHCDVFILREVFLTDTESAGHTDSRTAGHNTGHTVGHTAGHPYPATLLDPPAQAAREIEAMIRVLVQRALIGLHTLAPQDSDILGWIDRLLSLRQRYTIDLDRYARIVREWSPQREKKYLTDVHFYDRTDPLIALARAIQRRQPRPHTLESALAATGESSSRYARALAKSIDYIRSAGALLDGRISPEAARGPLEIGVPERSLVFKADQRTTAP